MRRSFCFTGALRARLGGGARLALALALACAALLTVGAGVAAAATGSLEGTVTNHKAQDLKGIEVSATNEHGTTTGPVTTAVNGTYEISGLAEGEYTVSFTDPKGEYVETSETAFVEEGEATELNAILTKYAALSGVVTSASTGSGIGGVYVFVRKAFYEYEEAVTEADGHYSITHLVPGEYEVVFSAYEGGYIPQSTSVVLGEGEARTLNASLREGGKISGTVTDAYSHVGLEKIEVYASSSSGSGYARTNSKGEYTIIGLPSGSYKVSFEWEFSKAEYEAFEKAPRLIPKYLTQYFNDEPSSLTANAVTVSEGATSSGVNAQMVPSIPHNTAAPAISGAAKVGSVLNCSDGSWTGEGFLPLQAGWPLTSPFSYQWLREGAAVSGSTLSSYVVGSADLGHSLVCEVTATNEAGHEAAKSASVSVAKPVPVVKAKSSKLVIVRGNAKVKLSCSGAPCKGSVQLTVRVAAKHHRKKTVVAAKGSYALAEGKSGTVKLRLTLAGAKALRSKHGRAAAKLVILVDEGKRAQRTVAVRVKH
ncbi:MAG TPA: carboxypeptidase-like regulatory domain-containing protein [Solirubrobacteraceae bacterium]|nr:carboxypeptidase-like regulatory domain-containing protein [Solirubrobacteraceae bacterium]